jgi:integrase
MALHYRKRGTVWHCRGSVRVGRRTFPVREFSTGCSSKAEAEAVGAAEESRIRSEVLDTGTVLEPNRKITVHDCITAYKARPGGLHRFDVRRLDELDAAMGRVLVSALREAWGAWLRDRGHELAPATVARWRSTLLAALTYGGDEFGIVPPPLRPVRGGESERIAYLTPQQEARLLAAYSQSAARVMLVLCETGLRTQEALRLDWRHVDWQRGALVIEHAGYRGGPRTKSGKSRRVGMRPVVRETLMAIWKKQGYPDAGTVFLNRRGMPYADTRQVGGNPLTKAHLTACRRAGITSFRIHDWRHHFAVWFLKRGGNLRALCQIAGWSSMRMVHRYAVFEQSDLDDAMARTARSDRPESARIGQNDLAARHREPIQEAQTSALANS